MRRSKKPDVGRAPVAQDQKRQVFADRRTKRERQRGQAKRREIERNRDE